MMESEPLHISDLTKRKLISLGWVEPHIVSINTTENWLFDEYGIIISIGFKGTEGILTPYWEVRQTVRRKHPQLARLIGKAYNFANSNPIITHEWTPLYSLRARQQSDIVVINHTLYGQALTWVVYYLINHISQLKRIIETKMLLNLNEDNLQRNIQ